MWEEIRLKSIGVIAGAELDLGAGLTVITGETGAGKTMVVTALGLLRGGRSDAGLVRHGDKQTRVEARVCLQDLPEVVRLVDESAGEIEDGAVILGRTISREGRSRAYVGGASVPASVLGEISDRLVAVHGQSDHHRLLKAAAQRAALDRFGGQTVDDLVATYRPAYARLGEVNRTLARLTDESRERARELDLLTFGLKEIAEVEPQEGEDEALVAEEDRLAHAEALAQAADQAHAAIFGDDATSPDSGDAVSLTAQAQAVLNTVREHDKQLDGLAKRLDEVSYLLSDVATELAAYAQSVDVDPARLAVVQDRRATLSALLRKYGPTVANLLAWSSEAAVRCVDLEGDDTRIEELSIERAALHEELLDLAAELSHARTQAASELEGLVSDELEALAMPHARIEVRVDAAAAAGADDLGPDGIDQVEMLLAANAGAPARPLNKGASGGELSRVMLALEVVLADRTSVPTFVFDEVDAGIGGKTAVEVGRRLARLARHAQVIVVTHLPQVAAFADCHYHVVKADDGSITTSGVEMLDPEQRVAELSRMLAGLEGSASAEAHARELLDLARTDRSAAA